MLTIAIVVVLLLVVLNGLFAMSELAIVSARPARLKTMIDRQVKHLVHLIDDLMDVARLSRGLIKLKLDMQRPEIDAAIAASKALAARAGIDGTPTFIINGVMHPGAVDDETLKTLTAES